MSSSPNAPGRCECDTHSKTTRRERRREARREEEALKKRENILEEGQNTWRCKWNGRTSRAMHKLHRMSGRAGKRSERKGCRQQGEEAASHRKGGWRAEGTIKTEPKDATRTDSNKIETNATWSATAEGAKSGRGNKGRLRYKQKVWGGGEWQEKL